MITPELIKYVQEQLAIAHEDEVRASLASSGWTKDDIDAAVIQAVQPIGTILTIGDDPALNRRRELAGFFRGKTLVLGVIILLLLALGSIYIAFLK